MKNAMFARMMRESRETVEANAYAMNFKAELGMPTAFIG